jgi:hypothetical protein
MESWPARMTFEFASTPNGQLVPTAGEISRVSKILV